MIPKYRLWDKVENKMHYVDVAFYLHNDQSRIFILPTKDYIKPIVPEITMSLDHMEIMSFIGRKDKNGVDIYVNDVVTIYYEELFFKGDVTGIVINENPLAYDILFPKFGISLVLDNLVSWIEPRVIGNIYENPELEEVI